MNGNICALISNIVYDIQIFNIIDVISEYYWIVYPSSAF